MILLNILKWVCFEITCYKDVSCQYLWCAVGDRTMRSLLERSPTALPLFKCLSLKLDDIDHSPLSYLEVRDAVFSDPTPYCVFGYAARRRKALNAHYRYDYYLVAFFSFI